MKRIVPAAAIACAPLAAHAETCKASYGARLQYAAMAEHIYMGLLRRPAEPKGLEYWVEQISCGMTHDDLVRGVMGSPEYRKAAGQ